MIIIGKTRFLIKCVFLVEFLILTFIPTSFAQSISVPEMVTFPNMVENQSIAVVEAPPEDEYFTLNLVAKSPESKEIQIPTHGRFALILEGGGDSLQVLDNDARDGEARARLPAQMLEGFIQAQGSEDMALTYNDPLYYVNQDLGQSWYRIGNRPFPIPEDWYVESPHYIFNFTNKGASQISTCWYVTDEEPDYPVGMANIGPEGGTVVLPGVGELKIPADALEKTTVIRMNQDPKGFSREVTVMLSPIVNIYPFSKTLGKAALIRLSINKELVGRNHPMLANYSIYKPQLPVSNNWESLISIVANNKVTLDSWHVLPTLGKVFVHMPEALLNRGFQPVTTNEDF